MVSRDGHHLPIPVGGVPYLHSHRTCYCIFRIYLSQQALDVVFIENQDKDLSIDRTKCSASYILCVSLLFYILHNLLPNGPTFRIKPYTQSKENRNVFFLLLFCIDLFEQFIAVDAETRSYYFHKTIQQQQTRKLSAKNICTDSIENYIIFDWLKHISKALGLCSVHFLSLKYLNLICYSNCFTEFPVILSMKYWLWSWIKLKFK